LTASADDDGMEVRVHDRGVEPMAEVLGSPVELSTDELPFDKALSLPLIRGLVDEVEISHREDGGSIVRMRLLARTPPAE
jgi:anti-sigma regulatory factor (Ser/Thr protein kinase)